MKKFILFSLLFSTVFVFSQKVENLYGNWKATDINKNVGDVIFSEDGFISFVYNGQLIDGKNFIIQGGPNNGKSGKVKFNVDFSTNPYKINIIAFFNDNGKIKEKGILKGLLKFINNEEILILFDFENHGYNDFTDDNKTETAHLIKTKDE